MIFGCSPRTLRALAWQWPDLYVSCGLQCRRGIQVVDDVRRIPSQRAVETGGDASRRGHTLQSTGAQNLRNSSPAARRIVLDARVEIAPECLREPGSTREPTPVVAALMSFRRGVSLLNDSLPRNSRV